MHVFLALLLYLECQGHCLPLIQLSLFLQVGLAGHLDQKALKDQPTQIRAQMNQELWNFMGAPFCLKTKSHLQGTRMIQWALARKNYNLCIYWSCQVSSIKWWHDTTNMVVFMCVHTIVNTNFWHFLNTQRDWLMVQPLLIWAMVLYCFCTQVILPLTPGGPCSPRTPLGPGSPLGPEEERFQE